MRHPEQKSVNGEKLSGRLTTLILIVALVPMMIVTGLVVGRYQAAYQARTQEHLEALVQKHARMVDTFLLERLRTVVLLAQASSCAQLADPDFLSERLADLHNTYGPVFQDMGFVNEMGRQVAYAGEYSLQGADYAGAGWFAEAAARPQFVSDTFSGRRGFPHCIVTVAKHCRGQRWVLRATIDFSVLSSIVETLRIGRTGYAFIVNGKGEFQTRRPAAGLAGRLYPLDRAASSNGHLNITALLNGGRWRLVAVQSEADAYAEIRKTKKIAFGAFFIGLVASVVTAVCGPAYIFTRMSVKG